MLLDVDLVLRNRDEPVLPLFFVGVPCVVIYGFFLWEFDLVLGNLLSQPLVKSISAELIGGGSNRPDDAEEEYLLDLAL